MSQMSIEILSLDSALSPPDQSFFANDCQTQHYSDIRSQTTDLDDDWLQGFDDIRTFCDDLEFGLNYEPELTLEAMTKEADTQYQTKNDDIIDYLDSTAFLSPVSIEPTSPQRTDVTIDHFEPHLDLSDTSAMTILEEILSSANQNSCEDPSQQCFDSELNVQYITEVSKESETIGNVSEELVSLQPNKRQQRKRKSIDSEPQIPKAKANKRTKTTVTEKKERKRSQNKSAANRYRIKKRAENDSIDGIQKDLSDTNDELKSQLQKLQMEFKVVYPLAKAAFASDPHRALLLQMLDLRVLKENLLE